MSRRLRAGFDVPFEPFALMREGRPTGLLIELVEVLLRGAGVDYELVDLPLAECEPALFSGRIDALAFKAVTPERRLTMDFSDPLIISGAAAFPRQGLPASTDLNAYAGMTAVTTRQGPFWRYLEANFPAIRRAHAETYEAALGAVVAGSADLAVLNLHAGIATAQRQFPGQLTLPREPYAPLEVSFATPKGRAAELLLKLNIANAQAKADGTSRRIYERWIGNSPDYS